MVSRSGCRGQGKPALEASVCMAGALQSDGPEPAPGPAMRRVALLVPLAVAVGCDRKPSTGVQSAQVIGPAVTAPAGGDAKAEPRWATMAESVTSGDLR